MRDSALRSKTKMVSKSWNVGEKRIRTHLLGLSTELRSMFICHLDCGTRVPVVVGLGKRILVSNDKAASSNLGLRRDHFPGPFWSDDRSVSHSSHISDVSVPTRFCPSILCCPLQLLWHHHPSVFTSWQTLPFILLFTQLLKSVTLMSVNCQANKSNVIFVWSVFFFSLGYTCILNGVRGGRLAQLVRVWC